MPKLEYLSFLPGKNATGVVTETVAPAVLKNGYPVFIPPVFYCKFVSDHRSQLCRVVQSPAQRNKHGIPYKRSVAIVTLSIFPLIQCLYLRRNVSSVFFFNNAY